MDDEEEEQEVEVEEEEEKKKQVRLARTSSMRVYVVDPYFKLAIYCQPLLESLLDAYTFVDQVVVDNYVRLEFTYQLVMVFFGVLVTFYGSHVSKTVSFLAAFRNERLGENLVLVRNQMNNSRLRLLETSVDNKSRRVLAILGEMDPNTVEEVIGDMWRCVLFAAATAKLHHAKTISLGLVLGEHLFRPVQRYVVPVLMRETRPELAKWYSVLFYNCCAALGVTLAFQMERVRILGFVSTAVKGAHMMVNGASGAVRHKYVISDGLQDLLVLGMMGLGLAWQSYFSHTPPPTPLQFVWFPVFAVEHWMMELMLWI